MNNEKREKGFDLNIKLICKDCRNPVPNIIEEFASGDLVCGDCGLILGDKIIDTRSEWRTFANDDGADPSRVGAAANPLLSGSQLDTIISSVDGGSGHSKDLAKIQSRTVQGKNERNLVNAYKDISIMCDAIGLTKLIADIAKQLFKRADDEKLLRGKASESIIAACIFIACRQENVPRTFKEICALTNVPKKEIGRCFKTLARSLETNVTTMSSEDLMSRFCSNLQLPMEIQRATIELTKKAKDIGTLAGKSPVSIAAACIYLISHLYDMPKQAREIALVAGVSEGTIKNAYKFLYKERIRLVDTSQAKMPVSMDLLPAP